MSERWTLYQRDRDGQVGLNLCLHVEPNRRQRLPHLATIRIPFQPREDGLPAAGQMDHAQKIEDKLNSALEPLGAVHVGHTVFGGSMVAAYYSPSALPSELTIKTGLLSKQTFEVVSREDAAWTYYAQELEPTEIEKVIGEYNRLHATLRQHGDDHTKVRPVDFAAFFNIAEDRSRFLERVLADGFRMGSQGTWEPDGEFWCEITFDTSIEPNRVAEIVLSLRQIAGECNGEFDGWACPVAP